MSDVPRQDQEAERSVLGAVLLGGVGALDLAREAGLQPEHFYVPAHEEIYRAMGALARDGRPIDRTTLVGSMSEEQRRSLGEGQRMLVELVTGASVSPAYIEPHAQAIKDAAVLRELAAAGQRILQLVETCPLARSREALERARAALDHVEIPEETASIASTAELIPGLIDRMQDGTPRGVSTGIGDLDRLLGGGLGRGQSIVIGARPSVGKSMLGCNLAAAAAKAGVATVMFSHEMTKDELMQRLVARETGVELTRIRSGRLAEEDWELIARASSQIAEWPLLIDDASSMTVADYRARIRKLSRRRKPGLVISDYLQLVKPEDPRMPREQQVAGISAGAKALAKDFALPMVLLAQLSRETEKRRNSRPMLSDLRESGAIENDADVVALMYQKDPTLMEIDLAKNRQGERGTVALYWQPRTMRCGQSRQGDQWA